ncbi:DysFN [Nesidiocoris tenuis]|uniref:DysFN n=1 Tax=Nesidiocoris tenuis TaxID=355587 RepID=A0ABN7ASZ0_9HEMI|nr:DysFN [Nesidiocoris tenuis]
MPSSMLFAVNNEGRVFGLSTNGTKWREFPYLGLDFKTVSAIPHFLWAVGSDRQIYVHVHGLDIPIRIKEESYENQRWTPFGGFSNSLLPTDRWQFSSEDGLTDRSLEKIRVPSMAWQWEGEWKIETVMNGEPLDHDGWTYAIDFPRTYYSTQQWNSCVRRRKWVRTRRYAAMNSWCAVAPLHKDPTREPFIDISVGGQLMASRQGELQVWAVTAHGRVMWRKDVSLTSPEGTRWNVVNLPSGSEVRRISCGTTGLVWAVLWSGKALVRTQISSVSPMGEEWVEVDSPENDIKLIQVCIGHDSVWAVTNDKRVWFRKGVKGESTGSTELATGTGWVEMVGTMAMVSVAPNDQVLAVGTDDRSLYFRVGVNPAELTGKRWRCINAAVQMSRASSVASSCSFLSQRSHRSTLSLQNTMGSVEECEWSESSRSAPTSLKIVPDWQKAVQPSSLPASEGSIEEPSLIHMANGDVASSQKPQRKLTAWSPIRSVGSLLGLEANQYTDPNAEFDGIVHPEREDTLEGDPGWFQADTLWIGVEAGALDLNPTQLPQWFLDATFSDGLEKAPWRNKMLNDLKAANAFTSKGFENYVIAVEMTSCVKSVECHYAPFESDGNSIEECILELEWISNRCSTVETASLSVSTLDKSCIKCQLSMSEIVCISSYSEPGAPRIAIHTRNSSRKGSTPLRLQFNSDNDHDEWMAYLSYIHAGIADLEGPPSDTSIWAISNLGDVYVFDHSLIKKSQFNGGLYSVELKANAVIRSETWMHLLPNGFPPDACLTVSGFIPKHVQRFSVNFDLDHERNIALHFNPRFDDKSIVRNSKENNYWMKEEVEGKLTLAQGSDFELKFICLTEGFKILVNGIVFTYFEHRLSPYNITQIRIAGSVELHKVTYDSKEVVVPLEEMTWKQVGGHLKKIETCSAGVTWGISSENIPYIYTGGWGGQFLNCLQKSPAGIHGMEDYCTLDVWENQRWNPLNGFSSRGLPTDRPMWSDSTGFHKRSKETTKLLNKHWQWVTDWSVDFRAPGGVDVDGWQYAVDFSTSYHPQKNLTDYVRRRRWIRTGRLTTSGPWIGVGHSRVIDISLQDSTSLDVVCVWAVSTKGDALFRQGVTKANPSGTGWEHIPCSEQLETISCGCCNQVWASTKNGSSYWRYGISTSNPKGELWELIEPPKNALIKKVSVGRWAVWALDDKGKIYVRREVTPVFPEGTHWQLISTDDSDTFKDISASGDEVWAITMQRALVRRLGVSCENPAGFSWIRAVSANWTYVSARSYTSKTMPQKSDDLPTEIPGPGRPVRNPGSLVEEKETD